MIRFREFIAAKFRRGALAFELSIVAPLFVMLALGIVEIGRGVMANKIVNDAAYEGARTAILNGSTNDDVTSSVQAFLISSLGVTSADVTIAITTSPASGNPDPEHNVANCASGDLIDVQVQVPFSRVSLVAGKYFAGKMLVGQSSMRHE